MEFHPSIVCLSETHLYDDAPDSFCPPGYIVTTRRDRSKHGGGILILIQEHILFEEVDTAAISVAEKAELVTIISHSFLFGQPSSVDVTLLTNLDHLWINILLQCHRLFVEISTSMNLPGYNPAIL